MLVSGVNKIMGLCSIISGGRCYTCPTKEIDGELYFAFKKEWHSVKKYITKNTTELVSENGNWFSRGYRP